MQVNPNENLKQLLRKKLGYLPEGDGIDVMLERGQLEIFHAGDTVIGMDSYCPDVFIVRDGIVRFADIDNERERTFAFALPGTIFMSKYSFVMGKPSYYSVEACCDTELLRISNSDYWNLVGTYHELTLFMLHYAYGELYFQEYKNATVINGSARERYKKMLGDRPYIIEKVPQKIIASYLGITPEYFSKLKREYLVK